MGEDRSADLSKSLIAYFRGKLLEGDGHFNIGPALTQMPAYVGFTSSS